MKIRNQLVVAFLLLAIVPMTAIVLYSYLASERAVRAAVEAEAAAMTEEMERQVGKVQGEIRRRVEGISAFRFRQLTASEEAELEDTASARTLVSELGDNAPLVRSFEFVPAHPEPAGPGGNDAALAPTAPLAPLAQGAPLVPVVIDFQQLRASVSASFEAIAGANLPEGVDGEALRSAALEGLEAIEIDRREIETRLEEIARERAAKHERKAQARELATEAEAAAAEVSAETEFLVHLDSELEVPVFEGTDRIGEIKTRLHSEELLRRIFASAARRKGEIPFALAEDGGVLTSGDDDRQALASIGLIERAAAGSLPQTLVLDNWVVVTSREGETGARLGIARPIRESLAQLRVTAMTNFAFGAGLIGLALLGVLPLAHRLTKGLRRVTAVAERLATGDLEARVDVRSGNELGQLARAFNDMASDLQDNQERLVHQELLQAEYERKSRELEEARAFQLSLLPRELPSHPFFEVAAAMKTATEVGGDYYDFRLSPDGELTAAVGDATGHGARAGTMVTVVKSLFTTYPPDRRLADFHARAARGIRRMELGRMSMALTLVRLTRERLTVSSAGMPPVLVHRAQTGSIEEIALQGMPLGGLDLEYDEAGVELAGGDTVLLMSDGFPELTNAEDEALGYDGARDRFAAAASAGPEGVVAELLREADAWAGGPDALTDDITFVAIRLR